MGAAREFEEADASVYVAPISAAVILNRLRDPVLLGPPLAGLALVEGLADLAVELVDVHRVEPVLELIELGGEPCERLVVEALLVLVALPQRLREELLYVLVKVESPEQVAELLGDRLLAGVLLWAAALVAGASVVDVAALLKLGRHRAAAMTALDQPGEGEPVPVPLGTP